MSADDNQQFGGLYEWLVVGHLWAVYPGDLSSVQSVIKEVGGREVSFL